MLRRPHLRRSASALTLAVLAPIALAGAPAHADVRNPWWYDKMRIAQAHEVTEGEGMRICVIDSSINPDIPELRGADVRLKGETVAYPKSGYAGHGTAMTALLVGQGKGTVDGRGITGMVPKARVDFYGVSQDPYEDTDSLSIDLGMDLALRDGCKILSISLATTTDTELAQYADEAQEKGAIVVAGGGVAGADEIGYPAGNRGVVGVGAIDSSGAAWADQPAQYEGHLAISAPGVKVPVGGTKGPERDATWDSSIERTGTSPATPIVAGVIAMAWSRWPKATANQIIQSLVHSTSDDEQRAKWNWDREFGYGIANITRMLEIDPTGWPDENPLLLEPAAAIKKYPPTVYRDPDAPASPAAETSADSSTSDDGAFPLVPVALAAAVVVAAIVIAVVVSRRRTASATPRKDS